MAIDPNDIRLSEEQKRLIAKRADQNGKPWQAVLQEALEPADAGIDEDTEFLALCAKELREIEAEVGADALTIEEAHRILSKVPGSMVEDIQEDRGEW